jgi:hypothetical protein
MSESPDDVLSSFGKCTLGLAALLEDNPKLNHIEQMFIENHMTVIQLAYSAWKRNNKQMQPNLDSA